jgi:tetratricopeptide (TPR) repeat protein
MLWSERFDRPLNDLFSLQDELTNHIAASVEIRVRREGLRRITRRAPASLDAYDLYLQGRALHALANERDTVLAAQLLERAVVADPLYAPAYAWQAYNVLRGFTLGWGRIKSRAALDTALLSARRAVELEPELSPCVARVLALMGRRKEALDAAESGVRANPCDGVARATFGEVLSMSGDHAAGVRELHVAFDLNPFPPPSWSSALGRALLLEGRHAEALEALLRCRSEAPDYRPCHSSLVVAFIEMGEVEAAHQAANEVLRLRPGFRLENYDGVFGFSRQIDTDRFLGAFRAAGLD